ncbi:hypothetical protein C8T65DRAFT_541512, partial [Cerioporus squamosus]
SGRMNYTVSDIISFWLADHAGRPKKEGDGEFELKYSPMVDWKTIRHAFPALTSMAVQICEARLVKEQRLAVRRSNGLHGSAMGKRGHRELCWDDISSATVSEVQRILTKHQPLSLHLIERLATPAPRKNDLGMVIPRKTRPPDLIAVELLSSLNFSHTKFARRLPAARGILYFAGLVPRVVFDYSSRVGHTPSYGAVYNILSRLAEADAAAVVELGQDLERWIVVRGDNAQHQHKQRERRLGRENSMKVGFVGTVAEVVDFDPAAADLNDHLQRIQENKRSGLTFDQLTDMVDVPKLELSLELQWLQVIVNYVPCLARYKPKVAKLYRTEAAILCVPTNRKTRIHPLAPAAKNEAITTELKDAVVLFLEQVGQRTGQFTRRLIPVGGDGLTFEKLVQLKILLQFQDDPFKRLDLIYPFLETWHTEWTFLSLVFETHWGDLLTADPSKLGHSAARINQKVPPNLKKVDYYPAAYVAYIILDGRMLDCWRIELECGDNLFMHFEKLVKEGRVPTLDDLRSHARQLHRKYSTQHAYLRAMKGGESAAAAGWKPGPAWEPPAPVTVPVVGRTAQSDPVDSSLENTESDDEAGSKADGEGSPPSGDRTLAQSILFMRDTMLSREAAQAVAGGDVGRMWNALKAMLFNFAGSGHTKYMTYLLEMICILEIESSDALREVFLRNWLVNPSGERMMEGDLLEEHVNRILEEAIEKKGAEWDSHFIRKVITPCVIRFMELKNHWGTGVGLAKRRGKHPEPHSHPEIRTLLETYLECGLHMFRAGRSYESAKPTVNTSREGMRNLEKTKLQKFIADSVRARIPRSPADSPDQGTTFAGEDLEEDTPGEEEAEEDEVEPTQGGLRIVDGELVVSYGDTTAEDVDELLEMIEEE